MAGKFRGKVGKLTKPKVASSTKKARAKTSSAMVKRSPKLPEEFLISRIAALTGSRCSSNNHHSSSDRASQDHPPSSLQTSSSLHGSGGVMEDEGKREKVGKSSRGTTTTVPTSLPHDRLDSHPNESTTRLILGRGKFSSSSFLPSSNNKSGRSLLLSKKKQAKTEKRVTERPLGKAILEVVPITARGEAGGGGRGTEEEQDEEEMTMMMTSTNTAIPHARSLHVVERVVPTRKVNTPAENRSSSEAVGLRLLHQALKTQGHQRLLPFQQRPDYEYRLRHVATLGVVELFRSLAAARKAGDAVVRALEAGQPMEGHEDGYGGVGAEREGEEEMGRKKRNSDGAGWTGIMGKGDGIRMTEDKVRERKEMVSKEAFLAALRRSPSVAL